MKTKNILLVCTLLGVTAFTACKKDKDEPKHPAHEQKLIKTWTLKSLTMPSRNNPNTDSSLVTECMKKITVDFTGNKGFQFANANKDCEGTVLPFEKGTWALSADGKELKLKGEKESKWTVQTLSDETLKATFRDSLNVNHNYLKTITLTK